MPYPPPHLRWMMDLTRTCETDHILVIRPQKKV
jgi:hypothetical protein